MGRTAPGGQLIESMVISNAKRRLVSEQYCVVSLRRDAESNLAEIAAPTLVIHGDHDHPEIAVIAARLVTDIPGARGETIPDADHYLPLRAPERLTQLLLSHLHGPCRGRTDQEVMR